MVLAAQSDGMWERDRPDHDRLKCSTSLSFCGTIRVVGISSTKAVSKQVLGGKNCFMIAVVDMSGDSEADVVSNVECPLVVEFELLLVWTLLVARGGKTWKVCRILATLS